MNYLAHAYLSFREPQVLVGNMISDFVKGKKQYDYPPKVLVGIKLHRAIDTYADLDPYCKKIAAYFSDTYRLYSAAFADVVCDYFLANDINEFATEAALNDFCQSSYEILDANKEFFDPVFTHMFPFMREQNWLYNYRLEHGIRKSFNGLQKRSKYIEETDTAFAIFLEHKEAMRAHYDVFFPNVKKFAENSLQELLKNP